MKYHFKIISIINPTDVIIDTKRAGLRPVVPGLAVLYAHEVIKALELSHDEYKTELIPDEENDAELEYLMELAAEQENFEKCIEYA